MRKNLIIDCDGVLYPLSGLSVQDFVAAMKSVYREELHMSGAEQAEISEKTIKDNHLGMFNYIREMCYHSGYDFDEFCRQMCRRIDYSKIKPDNELLKVLTQATEKNNVFIWSNNCREHLEKVFDRLFAKDVDFIESKGIKVFDISVMEEGGYFNPKQSEKGFGLFLQKISAVPENCVLFDDTQRNIKIAAQNGVSGVLINEINTLKKCLKPYISNGVARRNVNENN